MKWGEGMDKLTMDAIAAQQAGMSYGKYKAAHPGTYLTSVEIEPPKPPKPEPVRRSCARCGKMFEVDAHKRQRYCSIECAAAAAKERDAELRRKQREATRERTKRVCPICGKEFTPSRLHRTLCSQECAKESSRRSSARAQLKFKNSL